MADARPNAKLPTRSIFHRSGVGQVSRYFGWRRVLALDRKRGRPDSRWRRSNADETAFGVMSNRFRCLLGNMQLDPDVATDVILACCVLHNFLRRWCGKGYIPDALATNAPEAPTAACNLVPIYPLWAEKKPTWPNKRGRRWPIILWGWGPFPGKIKCSLNFMFKYFVNMFITFCIYS